MYKYLDTAECVLPLCGSCDISSLTVLLPNGAPTFPWVLLAQVISQVFHTPLALPAVWAVVWILPIVHYHLVFLHAAKFGEPRPARGASVRPLPCVGAQVTSQVLSDSEYLLTLGTPERGTGSHVHISLVLSQLPGVAEGQATQLALLLLVVHCPLVFPQIAFLSEALLAQRADEGALTSVRPLVLDDSSAGQM